MDQETIQLIQELVNRGEVPADLQPIVAELASRGVLQMPQAAAPPPSPTAPPPQELGFGEALWKGVQNFPQSAANIGTNFMNAATSPEKTLPMMGDLASGGLQNMGQMLGLDRMGGGEGPVMPEPSNPQQDVATALGQDYNQAFGGWENIKNTIANDPARIPAELAGLGLPGLARGGMKVAGAVARNTPLLGTAPEWLAGHSLAQYNPTMSRAQLLEAGATQLEMGIKPNSAGRLTLKTKLEDASGKRGELMDLAEQNNVTFDPIDMLSSMQAMKHDTFNPKFPVSRAKLMENKALDQVINSLKTFIANKYDNKMPQELPPKDFLEWRSTLGKELEKTWASLERGGTLQGKSQAKAHVDLYQAITKSAKDKMDGLTELDDQISKMLRLDKTISNQLEGRFHGSLAPATITAPLFAETAMKGGAGPLTTISIIKNTQSRIENWFARHLYNRMNNKPLIKDPKRRGAARTAVSAYSEGSYLDSLLEDEVNGQ